MITNRSKMDKNKFVKFNKDMLKLRTLPNVWLGTIGITIGVIFIICGILIQNLLVIGLSLGIFMILLFTLLLLFPKIVEINSGKVFESNAKGLATQEFEYVFDEQELVIKNGKGRILADGGYENIEQIVETETDFYLVIEKKSCFGFVVDKSGFEEGDASLLSGLLKEKIADYVEIPAKKA